MLLRSLAVNCSVVAALALIQFKSCVHRNRRDRAVADRRRSGCCSSRRTSPRAGDAGLTANRTQKTQVLEVGEVMHQHRIENRVVDRGVVGDLDRVVAAQTTIEVAGADPQSSRRRSGCCRRPNHP